MEVETDTELFNREDIAIDGISFEMGLFVIGEMKELKKILVNIRKSIESSQNSSLIFVKLSMDRLYINEKKGVD
jgi:hypothetical protein